LARKLKEIDLNNADRQELLALPGMTEELADRLIENRPYRNKRDLVARLIVPEDIYEGIKNVIHVDGADESVKIAS
jgi:DNA uptake protein ComE-like DNA-binding protein